VEAFGDALKHIAVVRLDEGDAVSALGFDDFSQGISATFAAVEDVVGKDPQNSPRLSGKLLGRGGRK